MKKVTLVAGVASLGALAAVLWTLPAAASTTPAAHDAHDFWPGRDDKGVSRDGWYDSSDGDTASLPEPGTLALLGLGLTGLGVTGLRRKRSKK
jgi:PEP-CTERM motif